MNLVSHEYVAAQSEPRQPTTAGACVRAEGEVMLRDRDSLVTGSALSVNWAFYFTLPGNLFKGTFFPEEFASLSIMEHGVGPTCFANRVSISLFFFVFFRVIFKLSSIVFPVFSEFSRFLFFVDLPRIFLPKYPLFSHVSCNLFFASQGL